MIKAVLCDLGDTLINFHEIDLLKSFHKGAKETYAYLQAIVPDSLPPFSRYRKYQQWSIRWTYFVSLITGREFNSLDILKRCSRKLNIPVPDNQFEELVWRWYKPLADEAKADPYAHAMLDTLKTEGLQLGIVSNTFVPPFALDRHLEQEKLLSYFPLRIYSCQVGIRKPNRRIFEIALETLGLPASEVIFVGDSLKADVKGSSKAGMYSIYKTPDRPPIKISEKIRSVSSLDQIPAIIKELNKNQ